MLAIVIWAIGLILTFKAVIEIWGLNADFVKKLLAIILILLTSWIGLAFYYFYGKDKMAGWLK